MKESDICSNIYFLIKGEAMVTKTIELVKKDGDVSKKVSYKPFETDVPLGPNQQLVSRTMTYAHFKNGDFFPELGDPE